MSVISNLWIYAFLGLIVIPIGILCLRELLKGIGELFARIGETSDQTERRYLEKGREFNAYYSQQLRLMRNGEPYDRDFVNRIHDAPKPWQ